MRSSRHSSPTTSVDSRTESIALRLICEFVLKERVLQDNRANSGRTSRAVRLAHARRLAEGSEVPSEGVWLLKLRGEGIGTVPIVDKFTRREILAGAAALTEYAEVMRAGAWD
jgi:hypothetical protein